MNGRYVAMPLCLWALALGAAAQPPLAESSWPAYGGAPGGGRYSPLRQIDAGNVDRLEIAWTFRTFETGPGQTTSRRLTFEATPVVVGDTMFVSTAYGRVFALDAASGRERWRFDAGLSAQTRYAEAASRGVAVWTDARAARGAICSLRVFVGTLDARLIALDGRTGRRCVDFNRGGEIALRDAGWPGANDPGDYGVTSPPLVIADLVVAG